MKVDVTVNFKDTNDLPVTLPCPNCKNPVTFTLGDLHAKLSLIESECHGGMPLEELVYASIKAKRYAEYDPGVGKMSDVILLTDKIVRLEEGVVNKLWAAYDDSVRKTADITQKSSTIMKGYIDGISPK